VKLVDKHYGVYRGLTIPLSLLAARPARRRDPRDHAQRDRPIKRSLGGNHILTLDEAGGVLPRLDVPEEDVVGYSAKEWNPGTDEHRNASYYEALNEPGLKKPLNGDPAIHVDVLDASRSKLRHDFVWSPGHPLHHGPDRGGGEQASAEHKNGLFTIGPRVKG
jgi:hypothetical protein